MTRIKIFDSEMHLMNQIWNAGSIKAIDLANWATENLGWKKNSTYSMLKKLLDKGAVRREEPGFVLTPLVSREEIAAVETAELVDKIFNGDFKLFFAALVSGNGLNLRETQELLDTIRSNTDK